MEHIKKMIPKTHSPEDKENKEKDSENEEQPDEEKEKEKNYIRRMVYQLKSICMTI